MMNVSTPGTRVHYFKYITNLRFLVLMCVLHRPLQQLLAGQRTVVALGHAAVRTERFDRGGLFGDVVGGSNGFCFTETRIRWKASGGSNDFDLIDVTTNFRPPIATPTVVEGDLFFGQGRDQ